MNERDQERAVNLLLLELRLLNARAAVLTVVGALSAALSIGGLVFAILVEVADLTTKSAWPLGVIAGIAVLLLVILLIPSRPAVENWMEGMSREH